MQGIAGAYNLHVCFSVIEILEYAFGFPRGSELSFWIGRPHP
jgi:hypothetical protein